MDFKLSDSDFGFEQGITIVTVNGKSFPYSTNKTLAQLIEDVKKIANNNTGSAPVNLTPVATIFMTPENNIKVSGEEIQRRDTVRCIKRMDTENGQGEDLSREDLLLGCDYVVQEVKKQNGIAVAYELVNIKSAFPMRVWAFADEVKFISRPPVPEKKDVFEMISKCVCGQPMVLTLDNGVYKGKCACGQTKESILESTGK